MILLLLLVATTTTSSWKSTASTAVAAFSPSSYPLFQVRRGLGASRDDGIYYIRFSPTSPTVRTSLCFSSISTKATSTDNDGVTGVSNSNDDQQQKQIKLVQDILYRIRENNNMPLSVKKSNVHFYVDGKWIGKIRPEIASKLRDIEIDLDEDGIQRPVFQLVQTDEEEESQKYLVFSQEVSPTYEGRTKAVRAVMDVLKQQGVIKGWRNEDYPVSASFYDPPMFVMERAAVQYLGVLEYGVHINGLVQTDDGEIKMWMARRAADKSKFPGMLDHIVAGGQPAGISLLDNCIKECDEEAGIQEAIAKAGLKPVGVVSYENYIPQTETISRVVLFNYDILLPSTFVPKPVDGEVQEFFQWSVDEILESMDPSYHDPIKPNCYLVIIDWLLREGHISSDIPGYLDVFRELRSGDCQ